MKNIKEREEVIKYSIKLNTTNLSPLRSGNISVRGVEDGIEGFLEARAGHEKFYWSPPDDTDVYLWRCRSWQKVMPYSNLFEISATFEEVFEP